MLAAVKSVQVGTAVAGLVLLVLSIVSQIQGLDGGQGFLGATQTRFAIVGAALVVASFVALGVRRSRNAGGSSSA